MLHEHTGSSRELRRDGLTYHARSTTQGERGGSGLTDAERSTHIDTAARSWRRAPLAAITWSTPEGVPDAASVFPLSENGVPFLALSYARLELARALEASAQVVLAVPASAADADAPPIVVRGHAEVIDDPKGDRFHDSGMIEMELAKYPASRRRLDSLLLRREHWWFLPRLLVRIGGLTDARTLPPGDALLVTGGASLEVRSCRLEQRDPLVLRADPHPADPRPAGPRPAVVLEHGGDLPALERPWERRWRGTLVEERFETDTVTGDVPQDRPLTLRQRMRAEKQLERACKAGLRSAGHA
jgi:hypothetical protein